MPFKIVFGPESIFPWATKFLAVERFGVSKLMFPGKSDQFKLAFCISQGTYLNSERFFDAWLPHPENVQSNGAAGDSIGSAVERL